MVMTVFQCVLYQTVGTRAHAHAQLPCSRKLALVIEQKIHITMENRFRGLQMVFVKWDDFSKKDWHVAGQHHGRGR